MSFILDALKKSEERRQQEQRHPTKKRIIALHEARRRHWPLWLALVLLPAALFSGWWLGSISKSTDISPTQETLQSSVQTETLQEPSAPTGPMPRTTPAKPAQAEPELAFPGKDASVRNSPSRQTSPVRTTEVAKSSPQRVQITPAPVPSRPQTTANSPEPVQQKATASPIKAPHQISEKTQDIPFTAAKASIVPYTDLSRQMRSRLPRLKISLHYYSADPGRRMVRLDNRLLHEGDTVADGLTIHEITPEAAILDYHGRLFRVDRP